MHFDQIRAPEIVLLLCILLLCDVYFGAAAAPVYIRDWRGL